MTTALLRNSLKIFRTALEDLVNFLKMGATDSSNRKVVAGAALLCFIWFCLESFIFGAVV